MPRWDGRRRLEDAVLTKMDLDMAMTKISIREAFILGLLYGLGDWRPLSLRECGDLLGISHERVRQLHERALGKLRC